MAKAKTNIAHSVAQRILDIHRATGERNEYLLQRYGAERLLYRLSISQYASTFILKGASLFLVWQGKGHRATKDIDLLGSGTPDLYRMATIFIELCRMETLQQDGVVFDPDSVDVAKIKEDQEYEGVRVVVSATLEKARISVQVDIGFGHVVTPASERIVFPVMLDAPAPELNAYPKETVFAEKFHAMVYRGMDNSRMKDFYDLVVMLRIFSWNEAILLDAIRKTFSRRETELPDSLPIALTDAFSEDPVKNTQWSGFVRRGNLTIAVGSLTEVAAELRVFSYPCCPVSILDEESGQYYPDFNYDWPCPHRGFLGGIPFHQNRLLKAGVHPNERTGLHSTHGMGKGKVRRGPGIIIGRAVTEFCPTPHARGYASRNGFSRGSALVNAAAIGGKNSGRGEAPGRSRVFHP